MNKKIITVLISMLFVFSIISTINSYAYTSVAEGQMQKVTIDGNVFTLVSANTTLTSTTTINNDLVIAKDSTLTIASGSTLTVNGNVYVYGHIYHSGSIYISGNLKVHNFKNIFTSGSGSTYGTFLGSGGGTFGTITARNEAYINIPIELFSYNSTTKLLGGATLPVGIVSINNTPVTMYANGTFSYSLSNLADITISITDIFGFLNSYNISADYIRNLDTNPQPINVTGITLNKSSLKLIGIGSTEQLIGILSPSDATNKNVTWSSSNETVAAVSSTGIVNAVGSGNATITATTEDGNKSAQASVIVTESSVIIPVTGITLNKSSLKLIGIGAKEQLTATVWPFDATNKSVIWSDDRMAHVSVSDTGLVTVVGYGTSTITATTIDGGKTAFATIIVPNPFTDIPVTGITLNKSSLELIGIGAKEQLNTLIEPTNATYKNVSWKSGDSNVSTVSSEGVVTSIGFGSTTITVTTEDGNKLAQASVSVVAPKSVGAPKSVNDFLSGLSVSGSTINFDKNTLSYNVIVENSVTTVTLIATAEDTKASVGGIGTKTLKDYSNVFNIVVTAESGAKKTYSVNVFRKAASGYAGALSKNNNLASLNITDFEIGFSSDQLEYTLEVDNAITKVEITATKADTTATVVIANIESLIVGKNNIAITVTSESGDVKVYTLVVNRKGGAPTVPFDKLIDSIKTVTSDEIAVIGPEDGIINRDILASLKAAGKTLIVKGESEGVSYEWRIDGSKITDQTTVNVKMSFYSVNQAIIDDLSGFAKGIVLSFDHNETLPNGTKVTLSVGSRYKDGDALKLYYFNQESNKLELLGKPMIVAEGRVTIELSHTSEYLLTQAQLNKASYSNANLWLYSSIVVGILLLLTTGYFIMKSRKV